MGSEIQTLHAFVELGDRLRDFCENSKAGKADRDPAFQNALAGARAANPWFTEPNLLLALGQWGAALTRENLERWLKGYDMSAARTAKTVGIVMAGNVPMVGFHDFLCVLISGHRVLAKLSSQDRHLMPFLSELLIGAMPDLAGRIRFVEGKMAGFDAVIATGSNNTGRYFEHYFGKGPHIIRRNRNSTAVLSGGESPGELTALGGDIFHYFGLGCRSVSKLYVPEGYDFAPFFKAIQGFAHLGDHHKYANNHDYNRAVLLMNAQRFLENGFLILREEPSFSSPISVLHYSQYSSMEALSEELKAVKDEVQCVVSGMDIPGHVPFGRSQFPALDDYADGVDTLEFLLGL